MTAKAKRNHNITFAFLLCWTLVMVPVSAAVQYFVSKGVGELLVPLIS